MERCWCLFLLLFCLFMVSCEQDNGCPEEEPELELSPIMNLLKNGACEEWTGRNLMMGEKNYLSGWSLEEHYGSISQENEIVYEGVSSARMSSPKPGITASISQKVVVSPGHTIRIRFHYYIEESCTGTKPRMYCYFREGGSDNIPNDVLSTFYDDATWGIIRGGGYGLSSFPLEYGEWQLFDYTIQVPAIAHSFVFEIHSYAGTTMYVDDCWVVDLDMYNE